MVEPCYSSWAVPASGYGESVVVVVQYQVWFSVRSGGRERRGTLSETGQVLKKDADIQFSKEDDGRWSGGS